MAPSTIASSSFSVMRVGWRAESKRLILALRLGVPVTADSTRGKRVVFAMYLALVVFAGLFGVVLGFVVEGLTSVALFGVVELPPTPLGLAVYGVATVGIGLGVLLGLVVYVSDRYADDAM